MDSIRTVVLVEGISDQRAVETLASRYGRDLSEEGVAVVAMGGAQAIRRFLVRFGPEGERLVVAGLCDAGEEPHFRRALEDAGYGSSLTRTDLERLGFHVCVEDLEDEIIRTLGTDAVEDVVASERELGAFRTLQKQAAWRERPTHEQLHRFMGSGGRRKIRYAELLVRALDLADVPRPLERLLRHI